MPKPPPESRRDEAKPPGRGLVGLIEQTAAEMERVLAKAPDAETIAAYWVAIDDPDIGRIVATAYHVGRIRGASDMVAVVYARIEEMVEHLSKIKEEAAQ